MRDKAVLLWSLYTSFSVGGGQSRGQTAVSYDSMFALHGTHQGRLLKGVGRTLVMDIVGSYYL